jgi:hypothetical protein
MTPEQREKKNQGDRDRRARQKAELEALKSAKQLPLMPHIATDVPEPTLREELMARKPRGGARPGSGPKPSGQAHMQVSSWKGTPAQISEFKNAGGGEWLRGVLQRRINKGEK